MSTTQSSILDQKPKKDAPTLSDAALPPTPARVWLVAGRLSQKTLERDIRVLDATVHTPDDITDMDSAKALKDVEGAPEGTPPVESALRLPAEEKLVPLKEILLKAPEADKLTAVGIVNRTVQLIRLLRQKLEYEKTSVDNLHKAVELERDDAAKLRKDKAGLEKRLATITTANAPQSEDPGELPEEMPEQVCALCRCEAPAVRVDKIPNNGVGCSNLACKLYGVYMSPEMWTALQDSLTRTFKRFESLLDERFKSVEKSRNAAKLFAERAERAESELTIWEKSANHAQMAKELAKLSNEIVTFGHQLRGIDDWIRSAAPTTPEKELGIKERLALRMQAVSEINFDEHPPEHLAFLKSQNAMRLRELQTLIEIAEAVESESDLEGPVQRRIQELLDQPF